MDKAALLLTLSVVSGLPGCALKQYHLHDEALAQSSQQALDAWKKVQAEPAIKTILENNTKIEKSRAALRETLSRSTLNLSIQNVSAGRWNLPTGPVPAGEKWTCEKAAKERIGDVLYCEAQKALGDAVRKYLDGHTMTKAYTEALKKAQAQLQGAKNALAEAEKKFQDEQDLEQADQKRLESLKNGIGGSLDAARKDLESFAANLQAAFDPVAAGENEVIDAIGKSSKDKAVIAAAKKVAAAHGGEASQLKEAQDELDKLLAVNKEDALKDVRAEWDWVHKAAPAGILKKEAATLQKAGQTGQDLLNQLKDIDFLVKKLDPKAQPGLNLILLGYAADIARSAKDRMNEEVSYLKTEIANAQLKERFAKQRMLDSREILWLIDGTLKPARELVRTEIRGRLGGGATEVQVDTGLAVLPLRWPEQDSRPSIATDTTILSSLERLARTVVQERQAGVPRPTPSEHTLTNVVSALVTFVAVKGYEDLYQRNTEQAMSAAEYAHTRRLDAINARERENLVQRGLQALAAYHKGGITESDLARVAQAGEVLWIAIQGR